MSVNSGTSGPLRARTVTIPDPGNLLDLLPPDGMSWIRRGEGLIAWGVSERFDGAGSSRYTDANAWWRRVTRHAEVHDDLRLPGTGLITFGSFAFSDASTLGGTLIVPRFVVGKRGDQAWLTEISKAPRSPMPTLADALGDAAPVAPLGEVKIEDGDRETWSQAVSTAVTRIVHGEVDKVVLARAVAAQASAPIDVRAVLRPLADDYPSCWTFHVDGLVGATPELLARVDHGLVTSRVLAGTIRPTGDELVDLAHAAALARSSKDREEHEYAVRSVSEVLVDHCASINVPEAPSVLHLPNVMHLATDVTGVLNHSATSLELVNELHPSAAVCGTPTLAAARVIDELEDLDRGRYAGPVGWTNAAGDGEWCIGLRSAEISREDRSRARLFAGCGIVAMSEVDSEWAESEAKLEPMRKALGAL
ncbi:isochorismate synthase [Demequina oxidasica]|uniref:isochorismate synthase n=1 Tax=Demequina oxidasica TaxID=676199 RepID=UPI0007839362|nr:isochorismate synthase [Demequina oxidasica]